MKIFTLQKVPPTLPRLTQSKANCIQHKPKCSGLRKNKFELSTLALASVCKPVDMVTTDIITLPVDGWPMPRYSSLIRSLLRVFLWLEECFTSHNTSWSSLSLWESEYCLVGPRKWCFSSFTPATPDQLDVFVYHRSSEVKLVSSRKIFIKL